MAWRRLLQVRDPETGLQRECLSICHGPHSRRAANGRAKLAKFPTDDRCHNREPKSNWLWTGAETF